jgi:hypothetical protein
VAPPLRPSGEPSPNETVQAGETLMRTYGHTTLRHAGATSVLALIGLVAGLIPLAVWSTLSHAEPAPDALWFAAAMAAGAAVGWVLKR